MLRSYCLAYDHCIQRSIRTRTRGDENQFQCVRSGRQLTGILPTRFICTGIVSFVNRSRESTVDVNIHVPVTGTALIDDAEGMTCKLKGHGGAVRGRSRIGTVHGVGADLLHPPRRIDESAVFVIVACFLRWLHRLCGSCGRRLDWDTGNRARRR